MLVGIKYIRYTPVMSQNRQWASERWIRIRPWSFSLLDRYANPLIACSAVFGLKIETYVVSDNKISRNKKIKSEPFGQIKNKERISNWLKRLVNWSLISLSTYIWKFVSDFLKVKLQHFYELLSPYLCIS